MTDTEQSQTPEDDKDAGAQTEQKSADSASDARASSGPASDGGEATEASSDAKASQPPPDGDGDDPPPSEQEAQDPQEAELAALREERDKVRDQLLRTTADFENFRRRSRREMEEAKMRGKDDAIRELLPIFDNLERAVQASESATEVASVVEGVNMVLKLFEDTAQRMGLNRVPGVGSHFDPAVHEAIQQMETEEHPPGTIVGEVAPGYMFGKRLLRAAMVVVARPGKKSQADGEDRGERTSDVAPKGEAGETDKREGDEAAGDDS